MMAPIMVRRQPVIRRDLPSAHNALGAAAVGMLTHIIAGQHAVISASRQPGFTALDSVPFYPTPAYQ